MTLCSCCSQSGWDLSSFCVMWMTFRSLPRSCAALRSSKKQYVQVSWEGLRRAQILSANVHSSKSPTVAKHDCYCIAPLVGQILNQSAKPPSLQHTSQSACSIHYAPAAMDMISHLFTLSVITDDFGQTAQFYMAHTDHHCGSVVQPVLNFLTCMHAWCTAPIHHRMMSTKLYLPWPKAQTATPTEDCLLEAAAAHRQAY